MWEDLVVESMWRGRESCEVGRVDVDGKLLTSTFSVWKKELFVKVRINFLKIILY